MYVREETYKSTDSSDKFRDIVKIVENVTFDVWGDLRWPLWLT